eukprot:13865355-Alexandrium_andersonii.AAC.1
MPGAGLFRVDERGGAGDCFFCAVAWSLHQALPSASRSAVLPSTLEPKGPAQAKLRMAVSEDTTK